jgi:GNAT superfamily N-acetyltransferase
VLILPAAALDLPALPGIESAAGSAFADIGMVEVADDIVPTVEELSRYLQAGRAWVAVDDADRPVAYLIADLVDGCLHIEQVSVHPSRAHQGVGRALIDESARWAASEGLAGLTLTTFAEVPWNAPYYLRCGFEVVPEALLTPGLRDIRRAEAARGLDAWPRVCMSRTLAFEVDA